MQGPKISQADLLEVDKGAVDNARKNLEINQMSDKQVKLHHEEMRRFACSRPNVSSFSLY